MADNGMISPSFYTNVKSNPRVIPYPLGLGKLPFVIILPFPCPAGD